MEATVVDKQGLNWETSSFVMVEPTLPIYDGWRCLHQAEGGYPNPDHAPVVRPSLNIPSVLFNEPMQKVSYKINEFNLLYTKQKWRATYNGYIAFTNGEGFDDSRAGPRVDYVNRLDLGMPLPKLMKGILCGGGFYTGTPSNNLRIGIQDLTQAIGTFVTKGKQALLKVSRKETIFQAIRSSLQNLTSTNTLTMYPGTDAIDSTRPISNTETWAEVILFNHWYFHAVARSGDRINNFPQGGGKPVLIAFFLPKPAMYSLSWFERWVGQELPDPLKIYHPL